MCPFQHLEREAKWSVFFTLSLTATDWVNSVNVNVPDNDGNNWAGEEGDKIGTESFMKC